MIQRTQSLIDKVSELKTLIGTIDGKTIAINVGGDANEQLDLIANKISALDGKTVYVNVVQRIVGGSGADALAATEQQVKRVFVGNENNAPVVQPVIDKVINSAQTGALKDQISDVINTSAPDAAATAASVESVANANRDLGDSANVAAAQTELLQRVLDNDKTTVAQLKNQILSTVDAYKQIRNASGDLQDTTVLAAAAEELFSRASAGAGISASQQRIALNAVNAAQREIAQQTQATTVAAKAAQAASNDEADSMSKLSDELSKASNDTGRFMNMTMQNEAAINRARQANDDANASILRMQAAYNALDIAQLRMEGDTVGANQLLTQTQAIVRTLGDNVDRTAVAVAGQGAQVGVLAGWWAQWGTVVHWVVAGFAEWAAVAIPGMIAMAAAMMVALQAATNVYQRLSSMYTVTEALGPATNQTIGSMLGLGSSFQKAQNAMQPQLYAIYGAAIDALKGKGSELATMGEQVIGVFDTFAAKVDVELKSAFGTELQGLISKGAQDFTEFGQILGNLGHAIANFAAAMPGLAMVLLAIIDVLSQFLKIISEIPAPILTAAFAFEEFLRWGSLLNGMIAGLTGVFSRFAEVLGAEKVAAGLSSIQLGMKGLTVAEDGSVVATQASMTTFGGFFTRIIGFAAANPFAAIAVAIGIAAGATYVYLDKAKSGMDQWIASANKAVQAAPDFAQVNTTISVMTANTHQLAGAQDVLNSKTSAWSALASGAQQNVTALKNAQSGYITDINTESQNVGVLAEKLGVSVPTAIAIAQGAGVKLTDTLTGNSMAAQVNWQKIQNLITGYQALGQQGNQLAADMNVVSITASSQLTNVQKLNTAWQNFIALGVNVQTDFISFQQGLATISTAAGAAGASFNGLNANSLTLRNDFESNITNMTKSLGDLNTALSFGGVSWNQYRQAIATEISEMLSAGNISSAQAAQLGAIASAAGYTGNSYSALSGWAQKYGGSQSQLNGIIDKATIALSTQKTMLQQIQGSMQQDVISVTAQAVLQQGGFQAALTKTYDAFKSGGAASSGFKGDLSDLDGILKTAGMSSQQISQYNQALIKSWTEAGNQAKTASDKTKTLNEAFDSNKVSADGLRDQIKNVFTAIGHYIGGGYVDEFKGLIKEVENFWGTVSNLFQAGGDLVEGKWGAAWTKIKTASNDFGMELKGSLKASFAEIAKIGEMVWDALPASWRSSMKKAVDAVASALTPAWNGVLSAAKTVFGAISTAWNQAWSDLVAPVKRAFDSVKNAITSGFDGWWKSHGDELKDVWNAIWISIKDVTQGLWTATVQIIEGGFNTMKSIFETVTNLLKGTTTNFWNSIVSTTKSAWAIIGPLVVASWDVVKNIFDVMMAAIKAAWDVFWNLIVYIAKTTWDALVALLRIGWDLIVGIFSVALDLITGHWSQAWHDLLTMLKQIWNAMSAFLDQTWNNLKQLFDSSLKVIEGFWDSGWNHLHNTVVSILNGITGFFKGFWNDTIGGFRNTVSGISTAWSKLQGIFSGPVNFLVHTVYDNGIARLWNDVAGAIGIPKLPTLAEGGLVTQGSGPKSDDVLARISKGETVVSAEHSQKLAGIFGAIGVPGYAGGGLPNPIGGILHAAGDVVKGVEHFFSNPLGTISDIASVIAALATGNTTALGNDFKKFLGNAGGATGELAEMIIGIPKTLIGDAMKWITGKAQSHAATSGIAQAGHPSGSFLQWVAQAEAATGVGSSWTNGLNLIALYESGYNPNAQNNTDINAQQGDPSRGLMQVIMTTFDAYHQAGTSNNIFDPVANIAAAINYIKARYGSINNVPGIVSIDHGGGYVGYDSGGYLMPGLTLAYNGTGQPERVTPPGVSDGQMLHAELHIDGKKFADAIAPAYYRKASHNNGNANANQYWAPR